jgi:hypothetical protein
LTGSISIVSGPPWPAPPPATAVSRPSEETVQETVEETIEETTDETIDEAREETTAETPEEPAEKEAETEEPELALEEDFEVPEDFGIVPDDEGTLSEEKPPVELAPGPSPEPGDNGDNDGDNISKAALFDYLLDLSNALPGDSRKAFAESDLPLKIATIRARLLGASGLRGQIERSGFGTTSGAPVAVTPTRIADTFSYLSQISGFLPKSTIGSALQQRIQRISDKLSRFRERE